MKKINFAEPFTGKIEKKYLNDALDSRWISKGPYVEKFENNFSKVMGCKFSVSVNNGTNALLLILLSLDLKKNDEIIVPSLFEFFVIFTLPTINLHSRSFHGCYQSLNKLFFCLLWTQCWLQKQKLFLGSLIFHF